jgi:hypothetical protein
MPGPTGREGSDRFEQQQGCTSVDGSVLSTQHSNSNSAKIHGGHPRRAQVKSSSQSRAP